MEEKKYLVRRLKLVYKNKKETDFGLSILSFRLLNSGKISDVRIDPFQKELPGVETMDGTPIMVEDSDGSFRLLKG